MSDACGMFVVFFFETMEAANLFLKTNNIELPIARKLIQFPIGCDITADIISADTGIVMPFMVLYPLVDVEPVILAIEGGGKLDSAS